MFLECTASESFDELQANMILDQDGVVERIFYVSVLV